ncbi:MAG: hypothetical protein KAF41_10855 [Flavobacterium sp.]|uniref:hypothetical protein n=1 Tax=Flavobacterium sp. Leaf359 TaxID=1736351 RepID=UPI0006F840E0|nr:hypothetical protein [Flavobacterium sp. Leaf359]KQS53344.1 hypothetical protein ASG38_01015 [Flavobacterium sp. Leaf359]MBU7571126.1 hypothetical protein [Flavobacterium sp.]PZO32903.1 MAG: hypothetical protein DCE86_06295 [Flavobacteriaceae bacterium]PZQ78534.1 MAG: hypothetical protein DI548_16070 [Flavobacterium johnsoniae]
MKKLILLLATFPFLLATQCDPDDSPCGRFIEIHKDDLITIENRQAEYSLNDVLWLTASVDRNQETSDSNIDLFELDHKLYYDVVLKKESAYIEYNYLTLSTRTTVIAQGESERNFFILIRDGNSFKNRIGIRLLESGNYTLTINNIRSYKSYNGNCNFTTFSILTDFNEMDSNSFSFVVN